MAVVHIGAVVDRAPGPKYRAELSFAELAPRAPLPRPATLEKALRDGGDGLALALAAPPACFVGAKGALRIDERVEAGIRWLLDAADAISARALVVPTLAEVRTGPRDRERLLAFFDRLRGRADRHLVWAPGGLWQPEDAFALARAHGIVCALDPLESRYPRSAVAYLRARGVGARARLGESALAAVLETAVEAGADETFIAIESERSFREATRLRALFTEAVALAGEA